MELTTIADYLFALLKFSQCCFCTKFFIVTKSTLQVKLVLPTFGKEG